MSILCVSGEPVNWYWPTGDAGSGRFHAGLPGAPVEIVACHTVDGSEIPNNHRLDGAKTL